MPPTLQQATTNPCLCWRLLDTPGQVWVSLLWGHCSFLLERVAWGKVQRKLVDGFRESCCGVTQDRLSSPSTESRQHVRLVTSEAHEILPAQGVFTGSGHIHSPLLSMLWNSRLPEESPRLTVHPLQSWKTLPVTREKFYISAVDYLPFMLPDTSQGLAWKQASLRLDVSGLLY